MCNFTLTNIDNVSEVVMGYPTENGNINVTLIDGAPLPFNHNYTMNITACNVNSCTPYQGSITISEWPAHICNLHIIIVVFKIISTIIFYNVSLSVTHDLQQAFVNSRSSPGSINVTGLFAENSNAMGYFLIVYNEIGLPEHFEAVIRHSNNIVLHTNVSNIMKGNFSIAMFDIEGKDGLPNTQAAICSSAEVLDGSDRPQSTYKY